MMARTDNVAPASRRWNDRRDACATPHSSSLRRIHGRAPAPGGIVATACCLLVLAGCRERPPEKAAGSTETVPATTAPTATQNPRTAVPFKPAPDEEPHLATPAGVPPVEPGSIPTPIDAEAGRTPPGATPAPAGGLRGVDERDDARAPKCLPNSGEAGPWVKVEPVSVAEATRLGEVVSLKEAGRLAYFRIARAARCAYAMTRDHPGGGRADVQAVLIEAETVEDAYGLLTCQAPTGERLNVGGETRVVKDGGLHLHCWQGYVYLHLWQEPPARASIEEMLPLLRHAAAKAETAPLPAALAWLPQEGTEPSGRWLLRHLSSLPLTSNVKGLPADALAAGAPPDEARASELLGLDRRTLMGIASYRVPGAKRPNVVWVVRYPSEDAAATAYARYTEFLANPPDPSWESTNLLRPQGLYLIGTWTAEEESLQFVLPRIQERLPR